MVHPCQLSQLLLPIPLGFLCNHCKPILLGLFICPLLTLPLLLGFCHLHHIQLLVHFPQLLVKAVELNLCIHHHLEGPVSLLIRLWMEEWSCFWDHGGCGKKG